MKHMKRVCSAFYKRLPVILVLNTGMAALLILLYFGLGAESFSVYVKEMASNVLSVKDVFIYLGILAIYGFFIEFIFRKLIQDRFMASDVKWVKALAIVIPVALYVLIHCRYGVAGIVYAAVSGTFLAFLYQWKKDWLTYSLWHMLWGFVVIPASMAACIFLGGQIRNDFLFAYKKKHIIKEKMYYLEDWGWVDKTHYRPGHFEEVAKAIMEAEGSGEVVLSDGWVTPLKISVSFSKKYKFIKNDDPMKSWAQVTGIMMDFMQNNETIQEKSPWYHGNQLSAWQFDDMSSCLLCCLDRIPDEEYFKRGKECYEQEELLKIWNRTGEELVGIKMQEDESWAMLKNGKQQKLRQLVDQMRGSWKAEDVEMKGSGDLVKAE